MQEHALLTLQIGTKIQGRFIILKEIGRGSFGVVYKAMDQQLGKIVAVKAMNIEGLSQQKKDLIQQEIQLHRMMSNPNIVQLFEAFQEGEKSIYMILEFCDGQDLSVYVKENGGKISEQVAIKFLAQILNGLKELHNQNIIHRDLKTQNIFLDKGICKIGDLGFAKIHNNNINMTLMIGTPTTMAPEMINEDMVRTSLIDLYSLGVVLFEMLTGNHPFLPYGNRNFTTLVINQRNNTIDFGNAEISDQLKDLIRKMLKYELKDRLSWKELYDFPPLKPQDFLSSINKRVDQDQFINQSHYLQSQDIPVCQQNQLQNVDMNFTVKLRPLDDVEATQWVTLNVEQYQLVEADAIQKEKKETDVQSYVKRYEHLCNKIEFYLTIVSQGLINIGNVAYQMPFFYLIRKIQAECKSLIKDIEEKKNRYNCSQPQYLYEESQIKIILQRCKSLLTGSGNISNEYLMGEVSNDIFNENIQINYDEDTWQFLNQLVFNEEMDLNLINQYKVRIFKIYYKRLLAHLIGKREKFNADNQQLQLEQELQQVGISQQQEQQEAIIHLHQAQNLIPLSNLSQKDKNYYVNGIKHLLQVLDFMNEDFQLNKPELIDQSQQFMGYTFKISTETPQQIENMISDRVQAIQF